MTTDPANKHNITYTRLNEDEIIGREDGNPVFRCAAANLVNSRFQLIPILTPDKLSINNKQINIVDLLTLEDISDALIAEAYEKLGSDSLDKYQHISIVYYGNSDSLLVTHAVMVGIDDVTNTYILKQDWVRKFKPMKDIRND